MSDSSKMRYKLLKCEPLIKHRWLKIDQVELEIDSFAGKKIHLDRIAMKRPAVVAILLELTSDQLILVRQFRYSALKLGSGWVDEVIAGIVEPGEDLLECAKREVLEETGYKVNALHKICQTMPSIGISDQVIHFYFGRVSVQDKVEAGGGLAHETEDIQVLTVPKQQLFEQMDAGEIIDGKTLTALYWYRFVGSKKQF